MSELVTIARSPTKRGQASADLLRKQAAHELVFAVVGHVGSGVSEVAKLLQARLADKDLPGGPFDVHVLKARDESLEWANKDGRQIPTQANDDLTYVQQLQDLGDAMRSKGDHAAVARALVKRIRSDGWKAPSSGGMHVLFRPFTGVAPRMYVRAFLKDRDLKNDESGAFAMGEPQWAGPWDIGLLSYARLEAALAQAEEDLP